MLRKGVLEGVEVPGSGYRYGHGPSPSANIKLKPVGSHPVLAGLDDGFYISDELYLKTAAFESRVLPLLRGEYEFVKENFTPPPLAPPEEQANRNHPPGSDLIVWANACSATPIVLSDVGDAPPAYENPAYRRMLQNALTWVASSEARTWAQSRRG